MARPKKYPDELVARGVRVALESKRPIAHVVRLSRSSWNFLVAIW
jgi:hypothetical protein